MEIQNILSLLMIQWRILVCCIIPPNWNNAGSCDPTSWKTITYLYHIVTISAADDLATQGSDMPLTVLAWRNKGPSPRIVSLIQHQSVLAMMLHIIEFQCSMAMLMSSINRIDCSLWKQLQTLIWLIKTIRVIFCIVWYVIWTFFVHQTNRNYRF